MRLLFNKANVHIDVWRMSVANARCTFMHARLHTLYCPCPYTRCAALDLQVTQYCPSAAPCPINIAIFGWRASNYSLTLTTAQGAASLTPGLPFLDTVGANEYNYYTLNAVTGSSAITLQLTPFSGDPDMAVGNSALNLTRPNLDDPTTYCAASATSRRDVVEIFPNTVSGAHTRTPWHGACHN